MNYEEFVKMGLNGEAPLKLVLCGDVVVSGEAKVGVVAVVYATTDKALAEQKIQELSKLNPDKYYMVYSVPLDVDLTKLDHYPSIAITKEDLQ